MFSYCHLTVAPLCGACKSRGKTRLLQTGTMALSAKELHRYLDICQLRMRKQKQTKCISSLNIWKVLSLVKSKEVYTFSFCVIYRGYDDMTRLEHIHLYDE